MPDSTDVTTIAILAGCVTGGVLAGLVLRAVFARFAHRASDEAHTWYAQGWRLLKDLAIPAGTIAGLYAATVWWRLDQPIRGIVDKILLVLIVVTVVLAVARVTASVASTIALARSGGAEQSASIFVNIARIAVFAIGLLVLLQSLGISITPILTALGVGGLAVALALQGTLSNLFAGVQVVASDAVQPGDFIRLDTGEDGYVVDVNWRNTTVRQLPGNLVVIPNAKIADAVLTNFHQPAADMAVLVQVGVSYDSDLEQVERATIEVGREVMAEVEGGMPDHDPFIRYHTFADSSINFTVILRAAEYTDQFLVKHEFIKRLHTRYQAEGITIPFPMRTIVMSGDDGRSGLSAVPAARDAEG